MGKRHFAGGNAGLALLHPVERFTLDALFITLEQRTEHGLRCCRVRLPAVIAVRQCGEVALPVPGMRQRMAAGKAEIIRKLLLPKCQRCSVCNWQEQSNDAERR